MGRKQRRLNPEEMAEILKNVVVEEEPTFWDDLKQLFRWILYLILGIIATLIGIVYIANKNKSSSIKHTEQTTVSTKIEEESKTVPSSSNPSKNATTPQTTSNSKLSTETEVTSDTRRMEESFDEMEYQPLVQVEDYNGESADTKFDKDDKQQTKVQRKAEREQRRAERKAKRQTNNGEE